jgi:adenine/guanine phosphoribosyltransferase-like PRPP-binding protein
MKHLIHLLDKNDDVAEALKTATFSIIVTLLILGLAPAIMIAQASSF